MEKIVQINIGGIRFQTHESTLLRIEGSKLSMMNLNAENFDKEKNEYFFDRDPNVFLSVLNLCRNGTLHIPPDQCGVHVQEELKFWGIPETTISPCCWKTYYRAFNELETNSFLANEVNPDKECRKGSQEMNTKSSTSFSKRVQCKMSRLKQKVWSFLTYPDSSTYSKIWHIIYLCIVLLSISVYMMDKLKTFQELPAEKSKTIESSTMYNDTWEKQNNESNLTTSNYQPISSSNRMKRQDNGKNLLGTIFRRALKGKNWEIPKAILPVLALDTFCNCVFTLEFALRLATCPNFVSFISFLTIADFISVVGFIISAFCKAELYNILHMCSECIHNPVNCDNPEVCIEQYYHYVRILTFSNCLLSFRNFRICILGRLSTRFNTLLLATKRSRRELFMFVLVAFVMSIVFAGLIFNVNENVEGLDSDKKENKFQNFFEAVYWAIITMTTVGYGDIYPTNSKGKIIAICCSISGLFLLTMPISVISANFCDLYFGMKDMLRQKQTYKPNENSFICVIFNKCMSKCQNIRGSINTA